MKKDKGEVQDFLSVLISIIAIVIICLGFFDSINILRLKASIGQTARKYILEMETKGYLTEESKRDLQQELGDMGITDVNMDGTTQSAIGYGNTIRLCITGNLHYMTHEIINLFRLNKEERVYRIYEVRESTAKN